MSSTSIKNIQDQSGYHMYEFQCPICPTEYYSDDDADMANLTMRMKTWLHNGLGFTVVVWNKHHKRGWEVA